MSDTDHAVPVVGCAEHYNALIVEGNDPVYDLPIMKEYMDQWDGQTLLDRLQLSPDCSVLEIGVGTGRLAVRVTPLCGEFVGVDISEKTVEQGRRNLSSYTNAHLIHGDFLTVFLPQRFECIYSSLTWLHLQDKQAAMNRVASLLKDTGRFVLSISKNDDEWIDYGTRKVRIYPDNLQNTLETARHAKLELIDYAETPFAHVLVFKYASE